VTTSETAGREGEKQRVGWFELFYDLVLVATINRAAQVFGDSPTWSTGSLIAGGLAVILVLWLATTVNLGSFAQRSGIRQVLVVVQMVAIVIAALATGQRDGLPTVTGFIALAMAFGSITLLFAVSRAEGGRAGNGVARDVGAVVIAATLATAVFGVGACLIVLQPPNVALWEGLCIVAGVVILAWPLLGRTLAGLLASGRLGTEHLQERMGQLVLIVLGESLIYLVKNLSGLPQIPHLPLLVLIIVAVFAIWRIYFTTIFPAGLPARASVIRNWVLVHLLLIFGAVSMAAALSSVAVVGFADPLPANADTWTVLPMLYVVGAILLLAIAQRHRFGPDNDGLRIGRRIVTVHAVTFALILILWPVGSIGPFTDSRWPLALAGVFMIGDAVVSWAILRSYQAAPIQPVP
jgi:low temperature requirement protein LtrA